MAIVIEALAGHDRSRFNSGSEPLDRYLKQTASQDGKRHLASCYVAIDDSGDICGYYTLSATSVQVESLDDIARRKLPRYPDIPAILLGRMAVAKSAQGKGMGGVLVADAILRCRTSGIAAYVIVVDAKDQSAAEFYDKLGFTGLVDKPLRLFFRL